MTAPGPVPLALICSLPKIVTSTPPLRNNYYRQLSMCLFADFSSLLVQFFTTFRDFLLSKKLKEASVNYCLDFTADVRSTS
jgi:hypothetical protein